MKWGTVAPSRRRAGSAEFSGFSLVTLANRIHICVLVRTRIADSPLHQEDKKCDHYEAEKRQRDYNAPENPGITIGRHAYAVRAKAGAPDKNVTPHQS
jgi:hypothetical protein